MIKNTFLVLAASLALSPAASAVDAGEQATIYIFNPATNLHLKPAGFHIGKADSRVDAVTHQARFPHEAWLVTTTGRTDKKGNPTVTIESLNKSVGGYKYLSIAGVVEDGPKDPSVVGQMEISMSNQPFEWTAEEASSGTTLNVGHAPGYVLTFRENGNCVLGWDNDQPDQLVDVRRVNADAAQ